MRSLGIMLLLAIFLQGCGRKGPLFMPAPVANAQTSSDSSKPNK